MMSIAAPDFEFISAMVRSHAAIVLEPGKEYLVEGRLGPLARDQGYRSLEDLVADLRADSRHPLRTAVIDALTTNETLFFRDGHPFEALREDILPSLITSREPLRRLRMWSAATSSGQEAVSLGLLVREHFPRLSTWDVSILGTDISPTMISRARRGCYTDAEVRRGLPDRTRGRSFTPTEGGWQLNDEIRRMCKFEVLNLVEPWPITGEMDVVFLRNVLIYFDHATRAELLGRVARLLRPDGALVLGGVETTVLHPSLEPRTNGRSTWFVRRSPA